MYTFNILSIGNRLTTNVRKYPVHLHRRINKRKTLLNKKTKKLRFFPSGFFWFFGGHKKCPHLQTQQS